MKNLAAEKSAVAEHSATVNHMINYEDTAVLRSSNRHDGIVNGSRSHRNRTY